MGFLDQLFGRARRRREGAEDESFEARMSDPEHRKRVVYAYHEQTKHNVHRFAVGPHELDWDNQPDPFRRWEGAQLLSLDVVPPTEQPGYFEALEEGGVAPASLGRQLISQLLYDSLALSAWKQVGDVRWALRVNPSSGNLHPTEGYLLVPAIPDLCDTPAVLHYAPREHGLELRARIPQDLWDRLAAGLPHGSFFAGLASIHWREAWKYGERAFRYCQHDAGHAIAALSVAAAGVGWKAELIDDLDSDELAQLLGIHGEQGPDAEQPDTLLLLTPQGNTVAPRTFPTLANEFRDLAWQGVANDLSSEHVDWDAIDLTASASRKPRSKPYARWQPSQRALAAQGKRVSLRETIRQRRSCQTLDGRTSMPASDFYRMLEGTLPRAGRFPFNALPWSPRVDLVIFVHRVDGLDPGLYWLQRDADRTEAVRAACNPDFIWEKPAGCPADLPLSLLFPMVLRSQAVQLSCNQDIAGDGAFSLGMVADFEPSIEAHGAWFYPRLFWETGVLGQRLYLEAEAHGFRSTGIGCFFDDPVHSILGLRDKTLQSLYHFTVGKAVDDARLTTLPAYPSERVPGDAPS